MANFGAHRLVVGTLAVPFGYLLVEMGQPILAVLSLTGTLSLVAIPDMDRRVPLVAHRMTHSVLVALVAALVAGIGGWLVADHYALYAGTGATGGAQSVAPLFAAAFGFAVIGQAVVGHIMADMLTRSDVEVLWPVMDRGFSMDGKQIIDPRANEGLYVMGTVGIAIGITAALMAMI